MLKFFNSLFGRVILALILGALVGMFFPDFAKAMKPFGDGFVKFIKMMIAPLVFCVVVSGMCSAGDLKKVGRVGVKTVIYFEILTTLALTIGAVLGIMLQPGAGMNIDVKALDPSSLSAYQDKAKHISGFADFFLHLIPKTAFDAFTSGDILQVLVLALLTGSAISMIGAPAKPVVAAIDQVGHVIFKIIGMIIQLAPIGVFGAIAFTTGQYGIASLGKLGLFVGVFFVSCALFIVIVLGLVTRLAGFNIFQLIRYFREEIFIVFGTTSSDAVLPRVMAKLEALGIKKSTVGVVVPTGYSFNLDGFSIYLTLAVIFIAQATNTPLSLQSLALIVGVAMITSKGAHGIPGSAIVILAATLSSIPAIPAIGLVLLLPMDWFVGIARAVTNFLGNCVATIVIAAWEKDIDVERAKAVLSGSISPEMAIQQVEAA
ncbi:MAG TPA: C4-dicarboxylate transporter DctA [Chthoniobacterales bacterium]